MPNLMIGFPPSSESQVALATRRTPPFNRWAFQHVREIVPSADIPHDPSSLRPLPTTTMNTDNLRIPNAEGASLTLDEFLQQASTDALVVLRDGRVVIERYANGMGPRTPHILMSVSKSLLGLLTGILIDRGEIDPSNPLRPWCRKSPAPPTKEPAFAEWDSLPSPTDGRGENELGKASRRAPPTSAEQKQPPQSHMEPGPLYSEAMAASVPDLVLISVLSCPFNGVTPMRENVPGPHVCCAQKEELCRAPSRLR